MRCVSATLRRQAAGVKVQRVSKRPQLSRLGAVQVVAFRDTHRAEQLEAVAKEFSHVWGKSLTSGPGMSHEALSMMGPLCDTNIEVKTMHPMGCATCRGVDALEAKLMRDFKALTTGVAKQGEVKTLLVGSNDADDTTFVLLQLPPLATPAKGAKPTAAGDKTYLLLKMDVLLDDTCRRVMSVMERGQVAGGFDLPLKQPMMEGVQMGCAQTPTFPTHLIMPWAMTHARALPGYRRPAGAPFPDMMERVKQVLHDWVAACDSGVKALDMMNRAGCTDDFQLYDAYGVLCGAVADTQNTGMLRKQQVADFLEAAKEKYVVEGHVVDWAVCLQEAAGFVHWKLTHTDKVNGNKFDVEGMEVCLFEPTTGNLRAAYLFCDGMEQATA